MGFPFIDLAAQYRDIKQEIDAGQGAVFASGCFIMGEEVEALEAEIAAYSGVREGVGVDSGTRALELIYRALGIGSGDEVITTPFTFFATVSAILSVGAVPVFADIDPATLNISAESIANTITPRTRAICAVHLFGLMADMPQILDAAQGIPVIEDACQAIGASIMGKRAGAWGRAAALSFFPTKNLGGAGDGGMVLTNDRDLADHVRILRNHGARIPGRHEMLGATARLDALQAAVLRVKLPHLEEWNTRRAANAARYTRVFAGNFALQESPAGFISTRHQYTLRAKQRETLLARLKSADIPCAIYYPIAAHLQEACRHLGIQEGAYPEAERAAHEVFSLPVCPYLAPENQARVIDVISSGRIE
ncbi:MAG: DegT/DnrJ/EryC1/StrS family aminotransferase [Spirochaetota bacterium]|jgi:dTDP-4-amino-4,6-dideoxygalactose transaminase|nr:DegT/DnrJ/EryC1/StrS family aminotransferase [Spirochaetota bacterium]